MKEENAKVNTNYTRIKVVSFALVRTIRALNNCGIYDITVTMEDDDLMVVYDQFENVKYTKPVDGVYDSPCNGSCSGCKH